MGPKFDPTAIMIGKRILRQKDIMTPPPLYSTDQQSCCWMRRDQVCIYTWITCLQAVDFMEYHWIHFSCQWVSRMFIHSKAHTYIMYMCRSGRLMSLFRFWSSKTCHRINVCGYCYFLCKWEDQKENNCLIPTNVREATWILDINPRFLWLVPLLLYCGMCDTCPGC